MFYTTHTIYAYKFSTVKRLNTFIRQPLYAKLKIPLKRDMKRNIRTRRRIPPPKKKEKMKERERDRSNERKEGKGRHVTGFDLLFAGNQLRDPFLVIPERGGVSTRPPSELSLVFNR